jgi:hypothetical protein
LVAPKSDEPVDEHFPDAESAVQHRDSGVHEVSSAEIRACQNDDVEAIREHEIGLARRLSVPNLLGV